MAVKGYRLNWKGDKVEAAAQDVLSLFLQQFGLAVEGGAKERLYYGHGVDTGTLRRSIHSADPNYNWPGDSIRPAADTPERGGKAISPAKKGNKLVLCVGSGMVYARVINAKYHFMEDSLEANMPRAGEILQWAYNQKVH